MESALECLPKWDGGTVFNPASGGGASAPEDNTTEQPAPMVQVLRKFEQDLNAPTAFVPPNSKYTFNTADSPSGQPPDDLPVFGRDHERQLLSEPWPSPMANTPMCPNPNIERPMTRQCLNGHKCIARHPDIEGHAACGGQTLSEIMTPSELERFNEYGHHPSERRMCVLCTRWNIHAAYLDIRNRGAKPQNILINWYINPVGATEYRRECCIPLQNTSGWSGLFGTVVMLQLNKCKWVQDPDTLLWGIDQSASELPPDGAPVQLFRRGAEMHSRSN